jgi:hypothetical protein
VLDPIVQKEYQEELSSSSWVRHEKQALQSTGCKQQLGAEEDVNSPDG